MKYAVPPSGQAATAPLPSPLAVSPMKSREPRVDPDATLRPFLQSAYEAAAITGNWDRARLESAPGLPSVPRAVL
jgi:hypothetical protein